MDTPLTFDQLEIVAMIANGYRADEISRRTYRSKSAVDRALTAARKRTGAKTLPHLVSMVIAEGLLVYEDGERVINEEGSAFRPTPLGGSSPDGLPAGSPPAAA